MRGGGGRGQAGSRGKSGWKDAQATRGPGPAPNPCRAEEGSHQGPGRVRCWWAIGAACWPGLDGGCAAETGAGPQDRYPGHPDPHMQSCPRQRQSGQCGAMGGQEAGLCQFRDHWPCLRPGRRAGGLGEPSQVAELTSGWAGSPAAPQSLCGAFGSCNSPPVALQTRRCLQVSIGSHLHHLQESGKAHQSW